MNDQQATSDFDPNAEDNGDFSVAEILPAYIGRYRVIRILGKGGFGVVYLAYDDDLDRHLAIKVPHPHRVVSGNVESYLAEARTLARLKHPNIVTVHDVGRSDEFPCFVVSQFIDGTDLSKRISESRFSFRESAELIATVADAIHYAHKLNIVHRDIKPANILLDENGRPFVADFGLALREEDFGKGVRFAGTLKYMSPEQARGEGHRVDGRSDVFSLGVVLYLMLTGTLPFKGDHEEELRLQIIDSDCRPPRQIDDRIPKELERICLKALAKRAAERYTTAKDMADDLRHFHEQSEHIEIPTASRPSAKVEEPAAPPSTATPASNTAPPSATDQPPVRIVPKGLRSFDANDADFFLELLPGPRDRDGLPDSIRFWKSRIEERDADNTFSIGLIDGPSGCGKSSLFKAGVLPRLSNDIIAVYLEATARDTETRLLQALRKHCPNLPTNFSLSDSMANVRGVASTLGGKKLLIVIDQFEQWLHAQPDLEKAELVQSLRHCDGSRVQCIVMVRNDFSMTAYRFHRELEIDLVQGKNFAVVDLFDPDHARKVLAAFGRAFGRLPERSSEQTKEQREFLKQAVAELSQENKINSVRLALFAEMMKGRPWTPAALREVGGTEGLGARFLEETFSASTANPKHRVHQVAARAVLKALLPETGTDIKGHMKSEAELREASGYANRPRDFDDLIRILDAETRLITPTDAPDQQNAQRYYQLSHDYMVHSLRDWLTRKQRETRRGRAELLLAERASQWSAKPEKRYLPSLLEWGRIRLWTRGRDWTAPQRKMMRGADGHYAARGVALIAMLLIAVFIGREIAGRINARILRDQLLNADMAQVPKTLDEMASKRRWVEPVLVAALATESDPRHKLRLSLALNRWSDSHVEYLGEQLLQASPEDFSTLRDELRPRREALLKTLWSTVAVRDKQPDRAFRAACALIDYARDDARRNQAADIVVAGLINETPRNLHHWKNSLEPVSDELTEALAHSLEDAKWSATDRVAIIEFCRDFNSAKATAAWRTRFRMQREGSETDIARRKATLAAALISLGAGDDLWDLLKHTPNPTLRSYLIERLGTSNVKLEVLRDRLEYESERQKEREKNKEKKDPSIRFALILAMGAYPPDRLPSLTPILLDLYENDIDCGIHGAAGWVLRKWGLREKVAEIDAKYATGEPVGGRHWFVNKQGQTFSIIETPERLTQHDPLRPTTSSFRFAICTTEVTVAQFWAFCFLRRFNAKVAATWDSPMNEVSWHHAAEYCNWLSAQHHLPKSEWCYREVSPGVFEISTNSRCLTGYRMPAEVEWEFAARAASGTLWSFGDPNEELVSCYAWWRRNSSLLGAERTSPVGMAKPNDGGLFDMHGNLSEWCHESISPQTGSFLNDLECSVRGGSISSTFAGLSCQSRNTLGSKQARDRIGFRVMRLLKQPIK